MTTNFAAPDTERPLLATRNGINLVIGLLMASGSMCPDCGYGTRKTSKNWAKCKKCGMRVPLSAETKDSQTTPCHARNNTTSGEPSQR